MKGPTGIHLPNWGQKWTQIGVKIEFQNYFTKKAAAHSDRQKVKDFIVAMTNEESIGF